MTDFLQLSYCEEVCYYNQTMTLAYNSQKNVQQKEKNITLTALAL